MQIKFSNKFVYRHPKNSFSKLDLDAESLYLASANLSNDLKKESLSEKAKISLKKYQQRASTRCTPFGLFAGCGVGDWRNSNGIEIQSTYRHTRLDMNVVCELSSLLNSHPIVRTHLTFFVNNSLYKFGDKFRYIEYSIQNKVRNYQLSSVNNSSYLNEVLKQAQHGSSYRALVNRLVQDDTCVEEAESFIDELIQAQILTSNLSPNVTGDEFFSILLKQLKRIYLAVSSQNPYENSDGIREGEAIPSWPVDSINDFETIYKTLLEVDCELKQIDVNISNPVSVYKGVHNKLLKILPDLTEENLFQADLYFNSEKASLSNEIQTNLKDTILFLDRLFVEGESDVLVKFREKFIQHYEDRELPLLQVLDSSSGIGYLHVDTHGINPIADDIIAPSSTAEAVLKWNSTNSILLRKLVDAYARGLSVVEFTEEDIRSKESPASFIPPSLPVYFTLLSSSKRLIHFKNAGGSSASHILGRFGHGNEKILELISDISAHESKFHSDKIIAEIVHLPENRIGNILLRPHTHRYEIPFLAHSTKQNEDIIDLSDLFVSIKNEKIILRSKRHNKEVIPRLTSAHNFNLSTLPVYQFLCDLQCQYYNRTGFSFQWGALANEFDFLPRAKYKNVILAPAQWNIRKEQIKTLVGNLENYDHSKITEWHKNLNLPRYFLLPDGDKELLVNINDELSVKAFLYTIKRKEYAILHEFLFDDEDTLVKDKSGNAYTNELIAIMFNNNIPSQSNLPSPVNTNCKRIYTPGSEWLYYKIYLNPQLAEAVLIENIYPIIRSFYDRQLIEKCFFIRYADPEGHIRLRFKLKNLHHLAQVQKDLQEIFTSLNKDDLVNRIQIDTYHRELERYGFDLIDDVEILFSIDSLNVLEFLTELTNDEAGDLIRLKFACYGSYWLMNRFELGDEDKISVISDSMKYFFNEHGGQKELKILLDSKYRKYRKAIETILTFKNRALLSEEDQFIVDLYDRSKELQDPIFKKILLRHRSNDLKTDRLNLIRSLIHMNVNRLFKGRQRTYELIIYDFLHRSMKSLMARRKEDAANLHLCESTENYIL